MPSAIPNASKPVARTYILDESPITIADAPMPRQQNISRFLSLLRSARNPAGRDMAPKAKPMMLASIPRTNRLAPNSRAILTRTAP